MGGGVWHYSCKWLVIYAINKPSGPQLALDSSPNGYFSEKSASLTTINYCTRFKYVFIHNFLESYKYISLIKEYCQWWHFFLQLSSLLLNHVCRLNLYSLFVLTGWRDSFVIMLLLDSWIRHHRLWSVLITFQLFLYKCCITLLHFYFIFFIPKPEIRQYIDVWKPDL